MQTTLSCRCRNDRREQGTRGSVPVRLVFALSHRSGEPLKLAAGFPGMHRASFIESHRDSSLQGRPPPATAKLLPELAPAAESDPRGP